MRLPKNNWTQFNSGKLTGFLNETINVDFDKQGAVSLSKRPSLFYGSIQDSNFGALKAIVYFNSTYNFITDNEFFYGDLDGNNLTESTGSVPLAKGTDGLVCYGRLYVTGDTLADYWNGSAWNGTIGVTLTTGKEHPLAVFESLTNHKLVIGNGNTVTPYNSSHSAGTALVLPQEYEVTCIRYRNGYLYVGTKNLNGGEAKVFIWDGNTANANYAIGVGASIVSSMTEFGDSIALVTSAGQLRVISGSSISTLANFPIYNSRSQWVESGDVYYTGKVFNRGMIADGDRIYISVGGTNQSSWIHGQYSGLWCFDPNVGLYHKAGFSDDRQTGVSGIALADNTVTIGADHHAETGDRILVLDAGSITGITAGEAYFAIRVSTTKFKLAQTRYDAHNGNAITLGGTFTSSSFRYIPTNQVGDVYNVLQGAVAIYSPLEYPKDLWTGGVIYGGKTDNGIYGVNLLADVRSVGRITTQRIYGSRIIETWQNLTTFLDGLYLDNEKIIIKAKSKDKLGLPTPPNNVAWDDTDTFTTSENLGLGAVSVGDEVTLLEGYSAPRSAHVTTITNNGNGTYTFTVDRAIGKVGNGGDVSFDNFRKITEITNDSDEVNTPKAGLDLKTPWVMFRIEMEGYDLSIPFIDVISEAKQ